MKYHSIKHILSIATLSLSVLCTPATLVAYTPSNVIINKDYNVKQIIPLHSLTKTVQKGFDELAFRVIVNVPITDNKTYTALINKATGFDKFSVSVTTHTKQNYATLVIFPTYKQAYRITRTLNHPNLRNKLTDSDLKLLTTCKGILKEIIKPNMTSYDKELAIHDYIINTTTYNKQVPPTNDPSYTAYGALINHVAVCEGFSEATKLLLNLSYIQCEIIYGSTSSNQNHAWNMVKLDGEWYMLDTTFDNVVSNTGETLSHKFFNVKGSDLLKTHKWNASNYPVAKGTTYAYKG